MKSSIFNPKSEIQFEPPWFWIALAILFLAVLNSAALAAPNQRQQAQTAYPIPIFLVSSTDHVSAVTGLGANVTVTLSKNGASFAAAAGAISEIGNGWYALAGHATDRATLGPLLIHASGAGADPFDTAYEIVPYDPFARVDANVTGIDGQDTDGNNATLKLKTLDIRNNAGTAVIAWSTGGNGNGVDIVADGSGTGMIIQADSFGDGSGVAIWAGGGSSESVPLFLGCSGFTAIELDEGGIHGGTLESDLANAIWSKTDRTVTGGTIDAVTNAVTAGTVTDKTGYSLTSVPPDAATVASAVWTNGERTITGGTITSVSGNVAGKILGGGSSSITGTGARVVDSFGNALAPAATALSTFIWTDTMAGYLDAPVSEAGGGTADPWSTELPGSYAGGQAGKYVADIFNRLSGATLTVQSVSNAQGALELVKGDSYPGADTLVISRGGYAGVDPAGGEFAFEVKSLADYEAGTGTWTALGNCVITLSAGTLTATVELDPEDTAALSGSPPGKRYNYRYRVRGTVDGATVTVFRGSMTPLE